MSVLDKDFFFIPGSMSTWREAIENPYGSHLKPTEMLADHDLFQWVMSRLFFADCPDWKDDSKSAEAYMQIFTVSIATVPYTAAGTDWSWLITSAK